MPSGIYRVEFCLNAGTRQIISGRGDGEYPIPIPPSDDYTIVDFWIIDYAGNITHSTVKYWLSPGHHIKGVHQTNDHQYSVRPITRNLTFDPVTKQFIIADTKYRFHIELEPSGYIVLKIADQCRC